MPKQQGLVWMAQQAFDPVPSRTQRQQTTTASPALGRAINNIHLIQTCSDQHSRQAVPHVTPSGRTLVGLGGEPRSAFQWMGPTLLPSRPHSVTCPTCRVAREGCQCAVRTQLWPAVSPSACATPDGALRVDDISSGSAWPPLPRVGGPQILEGEAGETRRPRATPIDTDTPMDTDAPTVTDEIENNGHEVEDPPPPPVSGATKIGDLPPTWNADKPLKAIPLDTNKLALPAWKSRAPPNGWEWCNLDCDRYGTLNHAASMRRVDPNTHTHSKNSRRRASDGGGCEEEECCEMGEDDGEEDSEDDDQDDEAAGDGVDDEDPVERELRATMERLSGKDQWVRMRLDEGMMREQLRFAIKHGSAHRPSLISL